MARRDYLPGLCAGEMSQDAGKQAAARAAVRLVEDDMVVGLGTGTTASHFIRMLGERMRGSGDDRLRRVRGVPTSRAAQALASELGIPLLPLSDTTRPDLTIDGADEVDPALNLIKGGGGALVQEKIVAVSSRRMVVVADAAKSVSRLGAFPLPVAVVPFGWETTRERIESAFGVSAALRQKDGAPVVTDDGMYLLDLPFGHIEDVPETERRMKDIIGVVEVGLFVGIASRVLLGGADGTVQDISL